MVRRRLDDVPVDELAPFVPFDELVRIMAWRPDEHVTFIGPTRRGKTTLAMELLDQRRNVVVLATKPRDEPFRKLAVEHGYRQFDEIPHHTVARRVLIWPKPASLSDPGPQRVLIPRALDVVYRHGNRTVYADEVHYLSEQLHLGPRLKTMWTQGASSGVALVASFQRPAWVPRDAYSSATHVFVFGTNDEEDIKRLGGIGGMSTMAVRRCVEHLATSGANKYEFVYLNTRIGRMVRSRLVK